MSLSKSILSRRVIAPLVLAVWAAITLICWWGWGIDELEFWLTKNVLPVGFVFNALCLATVGCYWKGRSRLAICAAVLAVVVAFGANPSLANWLIENREAQFSTRGPEDFADPLDAIVVLGGCSQRLPSGRVEVNSFGQRIVSVAEFWHARKVHWIVATGGVPADGKNKESEKNTDLLSSLGVPAGRILKVPGRNTHDELRSVKQLVTQRASDFSNARIGLVTCAFHMPRAMRLAESNGLHLVPLPSGHRAVDRPWRPSDLIPDANALVNNSLLAKEWLAGLVGR